MSNHIEVAKEIEAYTKRELTNFNFQKYFFN